METKYRPVISNALASNIRSSNKANNNIGRVIILYSFLDSFKYFEMGLASLTSIRMFKSMTPAFDPLLNQSINQYQLNI